MAEQEKTPHRNCCQKTLMGTRHNKIEEETAIALGSYFGGGMRRGEVCGVVTGGLMALGLQQREDGEQLAKDFMDDFQCRYGSLLCRDILGPDPGPDRPCPAIIQYGIEKINAMIDQGENK